ncbi:MAG: outer membrane lipoprotein-sorting protein [Pseudomonadota bacterium]
MRILLLSGLILLLSYVQAIAGPLEQRGYEIAVEADRRTNGFGDCVADMKMVLRNREKQESVRLMRSRLLEVKDDGDKSLTIFDTPPDVRETALLTSSHKAGDDDQWLYLPALRRVKRISSSNKSGSFMGSEFSYEDLGSREVEKYSYRYLMDGEVDGKSCYMIELVPKDRENSGYSRIVSWLDQKEYRPLKEEYYDQKNRLLKTLKLEDYRIYLGFLWRAHHLKMMNHHNGRETELFFSNLRFGTGLTDDDFSRTSLQQSR